VGKVQRAVNTPATMQREMAKGEKPTFTSLVGPSAAPSQTPAASPDATPSPCSELTSATFCLGVIVDKRNLREPLTQEE
jgi:hypothetical protein